MSNPYYKDYGEYLAERFPGVKVQKLSVDAGFSCPNRDGTISTGGCIYCNNRSFTPGYCQASDSIAEQLRKGKEFFSRKYPEMKYLAYFQSFTGTHARGTQELRRLYEEASLEPDILGIIIGTRPDSLPDAVVSMLGELNSAIPVFVELGAETSFDATLALINRHHSWKNVEESCRRLHEEGIETGLHLIAGLPGEDDEMILETIRRACVLPIRSLKLHQLQVIRGTPLHELMEKGEIKVRNFSVEEYLELCVRIVSLVTKLRGRSLSLERFLASAPPEMVISPRWGIKNYEFAHMLQSRLAGVMQR